MSRKFVPTSPSNLRLQTWCPSLRGHPFCPLVQERAWRDCPRGLPISIGNQKGQPWRSTWSCFAAIQKRMRIKSIHIEKFLLDKNTFIAAGATAKKFVPLWYRIDSWPITMAPPKGRGTGITIDEWLSTFSCFQVVCFKITIRRTWAFESVMENIP